MKTLTILICLLSAQVAKATSTPADSLIIRFGKASRVAIYAPTKDRLKEIAKYDLNRIVNDMVSKLDSVPEGQVYAVNEQNGKRYLRDTLIVVEKSGGSVTVTVKNNEPSDSTNSYSNERRIYKSRRNRNRSMSSSNWRVSTDFHFGLNTWVGGPTTPKYNGASYELDPLGSRYAAFSFTQNPAIIRNNKLKVSIRYGLQVAWNNFMFQENVKAERGPDAVTFSTYPTHLTKSKLTVCNLELPVVPQFSIYNNSRKRAFNIGLGGFVGYRLDSYTKIKQDNGDKFHDHGSFYLNNLQYGLQGNVGIANLNFFVKYNLNNSFQEGRGPAIRPLSFGITI
ncbi:hypothetical protein J2I47_22730 [Fibrella sp. HMF5335]|uniref:Outer membrane protein beta-barrel domain-containing protein n=1 Tax=Fibrella rubiginis TaxID=2817060 RepID=A0A939K7G0_9BACT|nr:outer membrane beta-barrel protein [Fibrella rubiginis]MBO0939386.1 hypothetical protein [Fibrella rubiginis]